MPRDSNAISPIVEEKLRIGKPKNTPDGSNTPTSKWIEISITAK